MAERSPDSDSPWASDDVPVSDDAAPIVWELDSADEAVPAASGDADDTVERSIRDWRWPVAIVGLLGLVVGGIIWRSVSTATDLASGVDDIEASDEGVDEIEDAVPDTSPNDDREAPDPGTVPVADDRFLGAEPIELPDAVAAIEQPTEIVVRTTDNLIHTVSLPSGRVRTVGVPESPTSDPQDFSPNSVVMVAAPTATLIAGYDHDVVIVPREGVPFVVDPAEFGVGEPGFGPQVLPIGWIDADGADQFLVSTFDGQEGVERAFSVTPDGVVSPVDSGRTVGFTSGVPAQGQYVVNDAGGAYLVDADRTSTRISSGTVIAGSSTQVLLRECDEQRQCQFVLQSLADGERTPTGILPAQVAAGSYGLSLSPDGTAVSYTTYGLTNERVLVDLADGPVASTSSSDYSTIGTWAPDGSGEFLIAEGTNGPDGLVFLARSSAVAVPFGDELGEVAAIAVRYPDSELSTTLVTNTPLAVATSGDELTDLHLVTFRSGGALTLLDLDAGNAATWTAPPLPGPGDPQLFADGAHVGGYADSNGGTAFVSRFGELSEPIDGAQTPPGPRYPGPDGSIWARTSDSTTGSAIDFALVELDGATPTPVRQVEVPGGTVLGGDGRGGIVFESSGDIYASAGDGVERLTSGDLLGIGPSTALVRECSEQLVCDTLVLDRDTGDREPSGLDPLTAATAAGGQRSAALIGSMSPDGRIALVNFVSTGTAGDAPETVEKWFFFDLETGNPIGVEPPDDGQPIIWNADSTYAAYLADGAVVVYEHSSGQTAEVTGTDGTRAIAGVDSSFGPAPGDSPVDD